jgi:hypothetical protein
MVSFTFNSLILSASLAVATIATFSTAAPAVPIHRSKAGSDACGRLGSKSVRNIKYKDVADCYKAIPINRNITATTISAVHDLFRDYYVFTDSALTPQVSAPFASEPVDILKELTTIGGRKYTSDYQFHTDVRHAVDTLRDGHASYDGMSCRPFLFPFLDPSFAPCFPTVVICTHNFFHFAHSFMLFIAVNCYTNYGFEQNLTLYAPVMDGVQVRDKYFLLVFFLVSLIRGYSIIQD